MQAAVKARSTVKAKITRVNTFLESAKVNPVPSTALETRLEMLRDYWKDYEATQSAVEGLTLDNDMEAQEKEREEQEEKYVTIVSGIKALILKQQPIPQLQGSSSPAPQPPVPPANDGFIPKFDMPSFSGNYADWPNFKDVFTTMIHDKKTLKNHQKLHVLKLALKGDAARLLQSTSVTDDNYEDSWKSVVKRYENSRQLTLAQTHILLHLPYPKSESGAELRKLLDTMQSALRSIKAMKISTNDWDPLLVSILIERLDPDTRRHWELQLKTTDMPKFAEVEKFVEFRCQALETFESSKNKGKSSTQANKPKTASVFHSSTQPATCSQCQENHPLFKCSAFLKLTIPDRISKVKKDSLCFNCLRRGHSAQQCNSSTCRQCGAKHHTLLHLQSSSQPTLGTGIPTISSQHATGKHTIGNVLLATAIIKVQDHSGHFQLVRALLDSASEASFVTESLVQRLRLKKLRSRVQISGLSQAATGTSNGVTQLQISSRCNSDFHISVDAMVLSQVTGKLPRTKVTLNEDFLLSVNLADPNYATPAEIDVLLGADCFGECCTGAILHGKEGVHALETVFGWVLTGKQSFQSIQVHHAIIGIDNQLRKFWELEELQAVSLLTEEEKKCRQHFDSTHTRTSDGRFQLQLPFNNKAPALGSSRMIAERCFYSLEKRLEKDSSLKQQYVKFMREYIDLGHMELHNCPSKSIRLCEVQGNIPVQQPGAQHYFIPHHEIIKESSTTTKLRVVFNASRKTSSGVSLNERLMVGPKVQRDLIDLLHGFRTHAIAFTADIEKMYRQILVHPSHQFFQLILWRESPADPLQEFKLMTVTYGEASAPFQAQQTLQQLSTDETEFPGASKVLSSDFYMDDLMSGASNEEEALLLVSDLIQLLSRGGFQLRKWSSNSLSVLASISPHMRETQLPFPIDQDESVKTLGLHWNPVGDYFSFKVNLPPTRDVITKRTILSDTAKIFDPIGFVSPVIVTAKIMLQRLWLLKLDWDDEVPADLAMDWRLYRDQLDILEKLKIPRQIADFSKSVSYQLHGFCDASNDAYAAVVYLRCFDLTTSEVRINLVASKTRVSPVKQVSLPRLELCGAVLLTRLLSVVMGPLNLELNSVYCWTDSTVTLAWIRGLPIKWKTFVANRVTEIQSLIPTPHCNHVKSHDSPADASSRGILPEELTSHPLWWRGPMWLQVEPFPTPTMDWSSNLKQAEVELKRTISLHTMLVVENDLITRFSSLTKLKRITALILRFLHNARSDPSNRRSGYLTVQELDAALSILIRTTQKSYFANDIQSCLKKTPLPNSKLSSLHPFVDDKGVLRVGGRIQAAEVSWDQKFPAILPKQGNLTQLIIIHSHLMNLHAGPRLLLSTLQQQYWILSARNLIRGVVYRCFTCCRYRASAAEQLMGNLPAARLSRQSTFYYTGLDYAGPISLLTSCGRGQKLYKGYIAVFVCMATKAIHLECVSDLTSATFIAALHRFIARRSHTRVIFSDNGTNFVGANKDLLELKQLADSENHNQKVCKFLSDYGIDWNFIPPSAPHMGGLWEAGVKSVKSHLKKILGIKNWTYEEMSTALAQIESCLNSRPISALSSDPSDLTALTPGHFLVLGPVNAVPEPNLMDVNPNRLDRWQQIQQSVHQFWNRWQTEYLSSLQLRNKWKQVREDVRINDLVLIKDDRLSPCKWNLGRILKVHPGSDGLVRVVTVKTACGEYQRPVTKLCVLPIESSPNASNLSD